ncbi:hypothetical protein ACEWY4_007340 [Coilia grayii]|uniref:C2H2-type domain-containing protein n=1 Tax=Coilia grayii TaxID=363190 RepID=A0ABD1KGY7_9TELE
MTTTTFQTQITAIMDVLAKAAIAEISKLVEDDHVVIRLEMCRRENEIQTLKKRLFLTERDLRKAQLAAIRVIPERVSVGIQVESPGEEYQLVDTQETTPKEEKPSIEDQITLHLHERDQQILHNLSQPSRNSEDVSESDITLKREPEEVQVDPIPILSDCDYRSKGLRPQSGGGAIDNPAQSWPSFDETNCRVDEDPGCSYSSEPNSSTEANLFSAASNEDGSRGFPEDFHIELFNSVSVKEEGVCISASQNLQDSVVQTKDAHPRETVDMTVVQPQTHSLPRPDKATSSYSLNMVTLPTTAPHGRPTFAHTDSQAHPIHTVLGSHMHSTQVPHSQAPTSSHTHPPYAHGLPPSRHLVVRPRTPGLIHRRGSMVSGSSHHRVFICSLCGKSYPRFCQLEAHQRSHTGIKPYRCMECGKRFTQKTRLKTHQSVHTGERPFSCRLCGKRFNRQDNCLRHERFHRARNPSSRLSMGRGLSS